MKKTIISHAICFIIGVIITLTCCFFYQKKRNTQLNENIIVSGDTDKIKITKIKNKKDRIEFNVHAIDKGTIRTAIRKIDFCPKIYKNSLSFVLGGGIVNNLPIISYGIEYRYQIISRAHILTGIDIDFINGNRYYGTKAKIGVGFNFGGKK